MLSSIVLMLNLARKQKKKTAYRRPRRRASEGTKSCNYTSCTVVAAMTKIIADRLFKVIRHVNNNEISLAPLKSFHVIQH